MWLCIYVWIAVWISMWISMWIFCESIWVKIASVFRSNTPIENPLEIHQRIHWKIHGADFHLRGGSWIFVVYLFWAVGLFRFVTLGHYKWWIDMPRAIMRMVSMARLWLPYDFVGVNVVQKLTIRLKSNCQFYPRNATEKYKKNKNPQQIHSAVGRGRLLGLQLIPTVQWKCFRKFQIKPQRLWIQNPMFFVRLRFVLQNTK